MDYIFIGYAYNSSVYLFIKHKSSIKNIHHNTIMETKNVTFFKDVFLWKEAQENHLVRIIIKVSLYNNHQLKDEEVKFRMSKREKMTKIIVPNFLTYLLKNKPQIYFKIISCPEAFYWTEIVNNEIESIINNYT